MSDHDRTHVAPVEMTVERNPDGEGVATYTAYRMPPAHPDDPWADITGVPCPVAGCDQTLVWYEAGYVPGYRVCMARAGTGYAARTLRHRFALDRDSAPGTMTLILLEGP